MYVFHTFKSYDKSWIKQVFYYHIKQGFTNNLSIIALLIYEQYAHLNLFYKNIDYRKYCYDLTRVASRFTDMKLYSYSLRCLIIVESLYNDTFPNIQKYHAIQLSHLYLQMKNYKYSLRYLKKAWQICLTKIQS